MDSRTHRKIVVSCKEKAEWEYHGFKFIILKVIPGGQLSASSGGFYGGEGGNLKSIRVYVDIHKNAKTFGPALGVFRSVLFTLRGHS